MTASSSADTGREAAEGYQGPTPERTPVRAAKRPAMRAAINAMCKLCIYDPWAGCGTWRQQTEACTATHCPLYPLRPVSRAER